MLELRQWSENKLNGGAVSPGFYGVTRQHHETLLEEWLGILVIGRREDGFIIIDDCHKWAMYSVPSVRRLHNTTMRLPRYRVYWT
jgi:hypothetical protein